MTQQEIDQKVKEPFFQKVMRDTDFFFLKGQQALNNWLKLEVSDQMKEDLIRLSSDYTQFLERALVNPEISKIKDLILEIIAYCDNRAKDKSEYNQYDDDRVLANASVRMGNWLEGLVKFKFKHAEIKGNSIINAFDYLLSPQDNCTILSDNHRQMVSENLLKKDYAPARFVQDLKDYYEKYKLQPLNPDNYTYLISLLIYAFKTEWIEEVIGLMASDGTGWQENEINLESKYEGLIVWNSKKPSGGKKTIKYLRDKIEDGQNFPLYYSSNDNVYYKATVVDFAISQKELSKKNWNTLRIKNYHTNFEDYNDSKKKAYIVFLVESIDKISPKLVTDFKFFGNYKKPRQDNLSPVREIFDDEEIIQTGLNMDHKYKTTHLNQIFFGPPGTGKTYFLLENIIPQYKKSQPEKKSTVVEAEVISNLPWWKVIALILMEENNLSVPEIKEHRYLKYKLETSNTNSLNQTVWGQLSSHTIEDSKTVEYTSRQGALIFDKKTDSRWYIAKMDHPVIQELKDELALANGQTDSVKDNYKFVTFHQSTSYETFVEGITPTFQEDTNENHGEIGYEIKKGSFYQACEEAVKLAGFVGIKDCLESTKEERIEKFKHAPSYCLLIDEISRGNISAIFGELITLVENDKRLTKNEIIVELPYSRRKFGVPPNLHIIGTMNTADRSVEALDTALRRRFSFTEMPPLYDLDGLKYDFAGMKGHDILKAINIRIENLLDRDHLIGHSYLLLSEVEKKNPESKLLDSFYRNIIPLLQEYFYGDYAKIGAVLGGGFVLHDNKNYPVGFASGFENEEYVEKDIYQIIDYRPNHPGFRFIQSDMTFEKAMRLLMNQTTTPEAIHES